MDSSNFQPPVRRSLTNAELEARVNQATATHKGIEAVMELLVAQESLRAQEKAEVATWISSMRNLGTAEALQAIQNFQNSAFGLESGIDSNTVNSPQELPVVEQVEPAVESNTSEGSTTWFAPRPAEIPEVIQSQAIEQELEPVEDKNATEAEPFSWFTQTKDDDAIEQNPVILSEQSLEPVAPVQEEVLELVPVGTESKNDFEALMAAAAAEEELTALEEKLPEAVPSSQKGKKNKRAAKANKRGFGSPVLIWLGLSALIAPIALVWALIGSGISSPAIAITLGVGVLVSGSLIAHAVLAGKRNPTTSVEVFETKSGGGVVTVETEASESSSFTFNQSPEVIEIQEVVEFVEATEATPAQVVESNVLIPSDENRNRGFSSQLVIWLGLSATLAPILLVWFLVQLGLSAPAIAVVLSVGYLISGSLIAVATIAGKRSGQSTGVISRAIFGVWGNALPNSVMFLTRVFSSALIVGLFAYLMNGIEARIPDFKTVLLAVPGVEITAGLVVQVALLFVAAVMAIVRGNAARIIQVMLSLTAFGLVMESFFGVAGKASALETSGTIGLVSVEALAGAGIIVLVNLTLWFAVGPNLSKAIPVHVRGYKVFMAAFVSNSFVPVAVGVVAVIWLGQFSLVATEGFSIQSAVLALPKWAQGSLVSGIAIGLVYAVMLSIRSSALDLVSIFRLKGRIPAALISVLSVAILLVLFAQQPSSQELEYFLNVFLVVAALSAGWIGMFAADVLIRKIAYHELSLARAYGVYKKANVLSLFIWIVSLVSAIAVIPVNLYGTGFMGFALPMLGLEPNLSTAAIGFVAALLVGFLLSVIIRIPRIRKQESEILELEARREQLNDIFVSAE